AGWQYHRDISGRRTDERQASSDASRTSSPHVEGRSSLGRQPIRSRKIRNVRQPREASGGTQMPPSFETEFAGKRALVTGGTRGIGEAIVQRLRGAGAMVITTSRSTPHGLRQPELFVEADLSTAEGVAKVVSGVRDRLAGVDILVHNVGGSSAPGGGFAVLTDDDWQHALNSTLLSAVRLDRGL